MEVHGWDNYTYIHSCICLSLCTDSGQGSLVRQCNGRLLLDATACDGLNGMLILVGVVFNRSEMGADAHSSLLYSYMVGPVCHLFFPLRADLATSYFQVYDFRCHGALCSRRGRDFQTRRHLPVCQPRLHPVR